MGDNRFMGIIKGLRTSFKTNYEFHKDHAEWMYEEIKSDKDDCERTKIALKFQDAEHLDEVLETLLEMRTHFPADINATDFPLTSRSLQSINLYQQLIHVTGTEVRSGQDMYRYAKRKAQQGDVVLIIQNVSQHDLPIGSIHLAYGNADDDGILVGPESSPVYHTKDEYIVLEPVLHKDFTIVNPMDRLGNRLH